MRIVHEAHAVCGMVRWSTRAVGGRDGQGRKEGGKGYGGPSSKNVVYFIKHTRRRDDIGGERNGSLDARGNLRSTFYLI